MEIVSMKLNTLKKFLSEDPLNLAIIESNIRTLKNLGFEEREHYLESLLDPKNKPQVRIPSKFNIPSSTFQYKGSFKIRGINMPDGTGFRSLLFNPFFLFSEALVGEPVNSDFTFAQGSCLLTPGSWTNFQKFRNWISCGNYNEMSFTVPDIFSMYRLVSAEMRFYYSGNPKEAQGVMGGAPLFLKDVGPAFKGKTRSGNYTNFVTPLDITFNTSDDVKSYSQFETNVLDGLRLIYFPVDFRSLEFTEFITKSSQLSINVEVYDGTRRTLIRTPDRYKNSNLWWFVYILKATRGLSFTLDCWLNFEVIPKPELLNYFPVSPSVKWSLKIEDLKEILETIRKKAIFSLSYYKD